MPKIQTIWSSFKTTGDGKDKNNGITEIYKQGGLVLGKKDSNFKIDEFEESDPPHVGEIFNISHHNIELSNAKSITYNYEMDNDDGWEVAITIYAKCDDGNEYTLGGDSRKIGNGEKRLLRSAGSQPRCLRRRHQEGLSQARNEVSPGPQSGQSQGRRAFQGSERSLRDTL